MGDPVYLLQIVDAESKTVARFAGRGIVERDLMAAVQSAIEDRLPIVTEAMRAKGRWWIRPDHFDAAFRQVLTDALPQLVAAAVDAVILDVKQDATDRM